MADVSLNPKFAPADLEKARANKLREIAVAKAQAGTQAWERFREIVFAGHPYSAVIASEPIVQSYKVEDVRGYYNDHYGAARTHLYVVGQFDTAKMKAAIEKSFGGWKKGAAAIRNVPTVVGKRSLNTIDRPGAPQSTIYMGVPAVSPSDADFIKFMVMDSLLGSSFGSRITSNIRENKGYTYSPNSFVWNRYKTGYWVENADVTTEATGASIKEILFEIDRLQKEPPSEAEMQGIKNYLVGIYVLQNSTRNGVIGQLESMNYNELDRNYLDTYVQKLTAVTAKDVQEMAKKYLILDRMTFVVVGDKSKIDEQLKPYEVQ
jgi:zinc protease